MVVITADAVHGGRGGGDKVWGGGGSSRELFYCKNLNNMSSKCITDLNH